MNTKRTTKRALLTSVMALVMCVVMLVGTTFAWFTDTASTGVNKITSGNLQVQIQDKRGKKIENLEWVKENGDVIANQDKILWEPGCTYLLTPFKIVNTGNLALKYNVVISGVNGNAKLLKAIDFTVKIGETEKALADWNGILLPADTTAVTDNEVVGETGLITISGHMKEEAGNEYKELTLDGVSITVYATQYTYEYDSEDNQYDANAQYSDAWDGTYPTTRPDTFVVSEAAHTIDLNSAEAFFYLKTMYSGSAKESENPDSKYWGYDIKLNVDIDMMNLPFEPIPLGKTWMSYNYYDECPDASDARFDTWGERQRALNGITAYGEFSKFDGNGHTIKNINLTSSGNMAGLFGEVNNICNLTLENVRIDATNGNAVVGALAASHANNIVDRNVAEACIANVHVKNVTVTGNGKYVGGLIGLI